MYFAQRRKRASFRHLAGRLVAVPALLAAVAMQLATAAPFAYVVQGPETPNDPDPTRVIGTFDTATNTRVTGEGVPLPPDFSAMALAFSPDAGIGYVAGSGVPDPVGVAQAQIRTFDTNTNHFVGAPITLQDSSPNFSVAILLAITPNGRLLYALTQERDGSGIINQKVVVVDTASRSVVGNVAFDPGVGSVGMKMAPDGSKLYLSVQRTDRGEIVVVDTTTNTVSGGPIALDESVASIGLNADGTKLYAITGHSVPESLGVTELAIINTVTRTVRFIPYPITLVGQMTLAPDGRFLWSVGQGPTGEIGSFDTVTDTLASRFDAQTDFGISPAFRPDGKVLYVLASHSGGAVLAFDPTTGSPVAVMAVGGFPRQLAIATPLISPPPPPPPPAFPHTQTLDTFDRADGNIGSDWSGATGRRDYRIVSLQLDVRDGGRAYWQAQRFGTDQEAFVTLRKVDPNATVQGLILKAQGGSPNAEPQVRYGEIDVVYDANGGQVRVVSFLPRAKQAVVYAAITQRFVDGEQLGARVTSSGIVEVYRNGTLIGSVTLNSADQAFFNHNGGRIGLRFGSRAGDALLDNFGGGTTP